MRRAVSSSTLRKNLTALATIFKWAARWGVIEVNPAADLEKPSEPKRRTRYLDPGEWRRLQTAAPPWLKPMLSMAISTGMRLGEIVQLTWAHVDRQAGVIHVPENTKTGTRAIPLGETALKVLDDQVRHVRSPFVFVDGVGQPYTSRKARLMISDATIGVMRAVGIGDASWHSAASFMVQAGVPLYEVQKILGHTTPLMTERYAHLQPEHLRSGMRALDAALRSGPISAPTPPSQEPANTTVPVTPSRVVRSRPRACSSADRATAF